MTTETEEVSYDFVVDTIVSVKAPKGTDPETLYEAATEELREAIRTCGYGLVFDKIYEG